MSGGDVFFLSLPCTIFDGNDAELIHAYLCSEFWLRKKPTWESSRHRLYSSYVVVVGSAWGSQSVPCSPDGNRVALMRSALNATTLAYLRSTANVNRSIQIYTA